MILIALIFLPFIGGLIAWAVGCRRPRAARGIALAAVLAQLALVAGVWARHAAGGQAEFWMETRLAWIPAIGASIHLGMDGLSLLLVVLTAVLGVLAALSWDDVTDRVGLFYFQLLWTLAAVTGVFLARDLLLFYVFWEMMLVPLYFLIRVWGHERREYAATKFFIYTQVGGGLLLAAILGTYVFSGWSTGRYTFDLAELGPMAGTGGWQRWLLLGFFVAFAVKLPALGLHTWLPDAHTQAPTAGSVVLAGLVLKAGAYGLLRIMVPLLPDAARELAWVGVWIGAAGVVYGALVALGQDNLKRLVAYSPVGHMAFVLVGVAAWTQVSLLGATVVMIAHGLSTGGLFALTGMVKRRLGTYDLDRMGGLGELYPRLGGLMTVLALATMALPGLANFVGEFLVLLGTWHAFPAATAVAATGMVVSAAYSLFMLHRVLRGQPAASDAQTPAGRAATGDLNAREWTILATAVAMLVVVGVFPNCVLKTAGPAIEKLRTGRPGLAPFFASRGKPGLAPFFASRDGHQDLTDRDSRGGTEVAEAWRKMVPVPFSVAARGGPEDGMKITSDAKSSGGGGPENGTGTFFAGAGFQNDSPDMGEQDISRRKTSQSRFSVQSRFSAGARGPEDG